MLGAPGLSSHGPTRCLFKDMETSILEGIGKPAPEVNMDVSKNSGTPKSSILMVFRYKPSILGYPYFGNTHMKSIDFNKDFCFQSSRFLDYEVVRF